ncbi:MAG: ADP-ribosylglycohydrolase family protein [Candidatus Limnocylindrales bacterium]
MHDPLIPYDLVGDELAQARSTGHDVAAISLRYEALRPDDVRELEALYAELTELAPPVDQGYREPSDLEGILATLPPEPDGERTLLPRSPGELHDRILGGWLGRIAGCNLGKPVEWGPHWTSDHLRDYLERANAYPLRDYIPVLDPMPPGFDLRENWPFTTRGNIHGSARDDDIDYAILGLHLIERHGPSLRTEDVAAAWLTYLPYLQVYTAERAAYRNLLQGIPPAQAASVRNPYREWIGALIRGDIFGWVNPGKPRAAAVLSIPDASLSHVANGIYGEMWAAALVAAAFVAPDARTAVVTSMHHIPPRSRLAGSIRDVVEMHGAGLTWEDALEEIEARYGHYGWVHSIGNACLIVAGLLWGSGDYAATVGLTVQGGWDTDSNGATAGSVAGVLAGASALPRHFVDPLEDRTRSALFGFDGSRISDLAARTTRLALDGMGG